MNSSLAAATVAPRYRQTASSSPIIGVQMTRAAICLSLFLVAPLAAQTPVSIHVDLNQPEGEYKPITNWFGYDELNYTTPLRFPSTYARTTYSPQAMANPL
jgi:hypothetical protein